ncbi:hypothetical protein DSM104299_01557 [Baekduia alba]|uniref:DUF6297 family protein n=1 Tax=Baekduia alba TaxID=2997333 RepID=UPI0023400F2E|nr:DUF6297 family protein [Baekduia alba]WCB92857.1 hypothetical protein DSM104299_01557 [Baekduia alba]
MASAAAAPVAPAPAARVRARDLRRFWKRVQEPPSLLKRLEPAYYVFITLAIGGPLVYGTASQALSEVATPSAVATWGPALALAALLAVTRWGAVQGPVVFSVADVAQLLGAPLRRAELALGRLLRGLLVGAGLGAVLAAIALIGVAGDGRGIAVERAAAFVVALALLAVLGVAGAALVQGSARWDRGTRLAAWPLLALGAVLVVLASHDGSAGRHVALWSGPWGWAIQPLVDDAGVWPAALALLAGLTAAGVLLALARRGKTPTERHLLRAEARNGAVAALYSMNARYIRRSLTGVSGRPARAPRGHRLRAPRDPRWAIPWRDAAALISTPQRLAEAVVLAAGGTAICVVNGDHPAAVGAGALVTFAGASRVLEPLRAETDQPGRVRVLLRAPMGRVLAAHAFVPVVVVAAAAIVAAAACAVAGALPAHGGSAAAMAVLATPAVTLCAALSSRRGGQLPPSVMATGYGDQTGTTAIVIVLWIVAFPVLAALVGALPVALVVHNGTAGVPQLVALLFGATAALTVALGWSRFAPD